MAEPLWVARLGVLPYERALALQEAVRARRQAGELPDVLLLLEHPPVYTRGRRSREGELGFAPEWYAEQGIDLVTVPRGGLLTYHGPGQLVGYPIVRLAEPVDVVDYVRRLEEALISVCTELGLTVGRVEGRSGVWLPATETLAERKIAAIGIRVQRGVALHGISFNCNSALDGFQAIVPCGIQDAGVTTLTRELGREVTVAEVKPMVATAVVQALNGDLPVRDHDLPRPGTTPAAPNSTRVRSMT